MKETAYGKINLGLSVLGKRSDGYHQVDMIMQSISLADSITFVPAETFGVETDNPQLPCDGSNLMVKAARAFAERTGQPVPYHLICIKRIFLAAGLAGGSTDAAAVLRGLNALSGCPLEQEELETLGAALGSDIPFCIRGGTQRARGRGEEMTVLPPAPRLDLVLVKPRDLGVSTAWVYGEIDRVDRRETADIDRVERAIRQGSREALLESMANDLEQVTLARYPRLQALAGELSRLGAEKVMMSGSGPTLFGIFPDRERAAGAGAELQENHLDIQIELAHTVQEE
jgi:4-diphosphocytidyl-2-C-methyl-D-erythritol kinase